jgi:hypothetical protein
LSGRSNYEYPDPIGTQLQVCQIREAIQALDMRDFVLDKVKMMEVFQVVDALDVFDLVVTQVQAAQLCEVIETFDVRDEIVIKFEILESGSEGFRKVDGRDGILAQTQFLERKSVLVGWAVA